MNIEKDFGNGRVINIQQRPHYLAEYITKPTQSDLEFLQSRNTLRLGSNRNIVNTIFQNAEIYYSNGIANNPNYTIENAIEDWIENCNLTTPDLLCTLNIKSLNPKDRNTNLIGKVIYNNLIQIVKTIKSETDGTAKINRIISIKELMLFIYEHKDLIEKLLKEINPQS